MEESKRYLGYICPKCRQSVLIERPVFDLAASESILKCPCGESEIRIRPFEADLQVTVPCAFCHSEHTATVSNQAFFRSRAIAFSCAGSGLNCCFVGEEGPVTAALQRLEESVDRLDSEDGKRGTFLNDTIMQEVLAEIKDIASRDGISCTCGSKKWRMRVNYSSVDITCAACGAGMHIPAATADDLTDLCCKPYLLIRGKRV